MAGVLRALRVPGGWRPGAASARGVARRARRPQRRRDGGAACDVGRAAESVTLPYPALHASHAGVWIADAEGSRAVGRGEAIRRAADTPMIVLNAPLVGQRLGYAELSGLDLLELFAFLRP